VTGQLFPALDADRDLIAIDEQRCLLLIKAVYDPPLGATGAGIDRLLLRHAARATMRSLLRGVGRSLTAASPPPSGAYRPQLGSVRFGPVAPVADTTEA
jgi:hypothetical protein